MRVLCIRAVAQSTRRRAAVLQQAHGCRPCCGFQAKMRAAGKAIRKWMHVIVACGHFQVGCLLCIAMMTPLFCTCPRRRHLPPALCDAAPAIQHAHTTAEPTPRPQTARDTCASAPHCPCAWLPSNHSLRSWCTMRPQQWQLGLGRPPGRGGAKTDKDPPPPHNKTKNSRTNKPQAQLTLPLASIPPFKTTTPQAPATKPNSANHDPPVLADRPPHSI